MGHAGMVLFSWLTEYSAEATSVWADSAIGLGLRIMPFPIAGMIVTPIWAVIATRYKNVKWLNALGFVLFVVSAVMMATASIKGSTQSVAADTVAGIAYSLPLALLITSAQLAIPPKYIGVGSALLATCRAIGSSISVSIFKSILTPQLTARLSPYVTAAATTGGLSAANAKAAVAATAAGVSKDFSPAALLAIPGMTASLVEILFDASRQAYVDAYRYVWYIVVGLSALGAVLLLFFKPAKDQMNAQIDAVRTVRLFIRSKLPDILLQAGRGRTCAHCDAAERGGGVSLCKAVDTIVCDYEYRSPRVEKLFQR